jgi:hypothetical protein
MKGIGDQARKYFLMADLSGGMVSPLITYPQSGLLFFLYLLKFCSVLPVIIFVLNNDTVEFFLT